MRVESIEQPPPAPKPAPPPTVAPPPVTPLVAPPPSPPPIAPAVTSTDPANAAATMPTGTPKAEPPKADLPKVADKRPPTPKLEPPKPEPPKPPPRPEPPKVADKRPAKTEPTPTPPRAEPPPKRVAVADSGDSRKASDQAYAQKRFSDAANVLYAAAKSAPEDEAKLLRHRAETIERFAKSYSGGTAPAASATDQFEKLRSAELYDQALGNVFNSEIDSKLSQVASKAALSYVAQKQLDNALKAVEKSESLGVTNGSTKAVRGSLDSSARDLYNDASKESDANPKDAKDKLNKLLQFVDPKSTWYDRAHKLLKQLG